MDGFLVSLSPQLGSGLKLSLSRALTVKKYARFGLIWPRRAYFLFFGSPILDFEFGCLGKR